LEIERLALVWTGTSNANWNITTANWSTWSNYDNTSEAAREAAVLNASSPNDAQKFLPGDVVLFTDVWNGANTPTQRDVRFSGNGAAPAEVYVNTAFGAPDSAGGAGGTGVGFSFSSTASYGLSGDAVLHKYGAGTLTLNGSHSYKGETVVHGGYLRIQGDNRLATGPMTVMSGGILSGHGVVGGSVLVKAGGYLSPSGSTPYNLTPNPIRVDHNIGKTFDGDFKKPVTLNFAGNVTLEKGATLVIRVQGSNTAGYASADKLNFTNAVTNNFVAQPGTKIFVDLDITDINQLSNPFFRVSVITGANISEATTKNVQIYSLNFPGTVYGLDTQGYLYTIPEPGTYGLFGASILLGLVAFRRHRAKRKGNGGRAAVEN
jgi:autotransporter-associated beta strand protein